MQYVNMKHPGTHQVVTLGEFTTYRDARDYCDVLRSHHPGLRVWPSNRATQDWQQQKMGPLPFPWPFEETTS